MENLDDYKVSDYEDEFEDEKPVEVGTKIMDSKFKLTISPKAKEKGNYYGNLEESEMLRQKQSENDPLKEFYEMQETKKAEAETEDFLNQFDSDYSDDGEPLSAEPRSEIE